MIDLNKIRTLCVAAVSALVLAGCMLPVSPAAIQAAPGDSQLLVAETQRWWGNWVGSSGYEYSYDMVLNLAVNGAVEGRILWTLTKAPAGSPLRSKVGRSGTEYVEGSYNARTREMIINGTRVDAPDLIGTDTYRLTVSADGHSLEGATRGNDGTWTSTFKGSRTPPTGGPTGL